MEVLTGFEMIAPSHGAIWRENPLQIVEKYAAWADAYHEHQVTIAYDTMWEGTKHLSYSGIAQKAAYYLLMQRRNTGSDTILIPDSMTKWAMLLNVSRPSLHRELKRLESQNTIRLQPHHVEIQDSKALQNVLTG